MAPFASFPYAPDRPTPDQYRRVAGQLSVPRTVAGLTTTLEQLDPDIRWPDDDSHGVYVRVLLDGLEREGLAVNIGAADSGVQAAKKVADHPEAVTMAKAKAQRYASAVDGWRDTPRLDISDDLYALTQAGHDALTAPIPDEPRPMSGARLAAAQAEDEEWHAENDRIIQEGRQSEIERARRRLEELEEGDK